MRYYKKVQYSKMKPYNKKKLICDAGAFFGKKMEEPCKAPPLMIWFFGVIIF